VTIFEFVITVTGLAVVVIGIIFSPLGLFTLIYVLGGAMAMVGPTAAAMRKVRR